MPQSVQTFVEETFQTARPVIDRAAGVIHGVKILGANSRNGRQYSRRALRDAAAIYEGLGVNANHPLRSTPHASRSVEEGVGWLENITVKPDGVYGDLNVIKSHPLAETIFEVAERKPDRFGLSHNASGDVVEKNGRRIVESIKSVRSVDLVQNPATVNSLFESEAPVGRRLKDLVALLPAGSRQAHLTRLLETDEMPFDAETAISASDDSETDQADPFDTATETMVLAVLRDAELTTEDKISQITQILTGEPPEDGAATETAETDDEAPVTESVLRRRLAAAQAALLEARADADVRRLLQIARLEATDKRIRLLKSVNAATRQDLIEEWSALRHRPASRPFRSPPVPLVEGGEGRALRPARGADEMLAAYR